MTTLRRNNAAGGVDGQVVTAGNSGGVSGDGFTGEVNTAGKMTYKVIGGKTWIVTDPTDATVFGLNWTGFADPSGAAEVLVQWLDTPPTGTFDVGQIRVTGQMCSLRWIGSAGKWRIIDAAGNIIKDFTAVTGIAINQIERLAWDGAKGTTTANGTSSDQAIYPSATSTTASDSGSGYVGNLGTTNVSEFRFGHLTAAVMPRLAFSDVQFNSGGTSLIGPYPQSQAGAVSSVVTAFGSATSSTATAASVVGTVTPFGTLDGTQQQQSSAAAVVTASGSAAAAAVSTQSGTAVVTASGTATASVARQVQATAVVTAFGTATASQLFAAQAAAVVTASGTAAITPLQQASAAAVVTASGTAAGARVAGAALSSVVTATGTASPGQVFQNASAAAAVTATGTLTPSGTTPVSLAATVTAFGTAIVAGPPGNSAVYATVTVWGIADPTYSPRTWPPQARRVRVPVAGGVFQVLDTTV